MTYVHSFSQRLFIKTIELMVVVVEQFEGYLM